MDCLSSSPRLAATVEPRLLAGLALLLLLICALLSFRGVDWFLVKRTLHRQFGKINWITTEELAARLADKDRPAPILLDARTSEEYEVSHLPGARLVDPRADARTAGHGIAKDAPIVTYCAIGYRSAGLAERLQAAGYRNVRNLEGSIFEWANERRPLVLGASEPATQVHPYSAFWGRLLAPELRAPLGKSSTARMSAGG